MRILRMKKLLTVMAALALCAAFIFTGCASTGTGANGTPVDMGGTQGTGTAAAAGAAGTSAGRGKYMETRINLPMPEGETEQYVIGLSNVDGALVAFTLCSGELQNGEYYSKYYRHTIAADGTITTKSEEWLNALAGRGGNMINAAMEGDEIVVSLGDYTDDGKAYARVFVSHDGGQTGTELTRVEPSLTSPASLLPFGDGFATSDFMDSGVSLLDSDGASKGMLDVGQGAYPEIAAFENRLAYACQKDGIVREYNSETGVTQDIACPGSEAKATGGSNDTVYDGNSFTRISTLALAYSPDGVLYMVNGDGIYRHAEDGTMWECVLSGATCTLGLPNFYISDTVVVKGDYDVVYAAGEGTNGAICMYKFDPDAQSVADTVINVFSLYDNETVRQAIVEFNKTHSNVEISFDYAVKKEGAALAADYINALNAELLAGKGPDILILDGLPVDSYIDKGVLIDLSDVLGNGVADTLIPAAQTAFARDGSVYAVPTGVRVPFAVAKDADAAALSSINALAAAAETGDVPLLSKKAFNYEVLARELISYYGDMLRSGAAGAAEGFLTDAKRICAATGCTENLGVDSAFDFGMTQEELNEAFSEDTGYYQFVDQYHGDCRLALYEPVKLLFSSDFMTGAAVADEIGANIVSIGGRFELCGTVGINRASKNIEPAMEFLRAMLSYETQSVDNLYSQMPVNTDALDAWFSKENENVSTGFMLSETEEFNAGWASAERRAQLLSALKSGTVNIGGSETLNAMLLPIVTDCLSGKATVADSVESVNSLLATYLSE